MEKINIPAAVLERARAATMHPAPVPLPAPTQTRAQFWARKNGGGYRTARKAFVCQQFTCLAKVDAGVEYFDTNETTIWPATKRICAACAEEHV